MVRYKGVDSPCPNLERAIKFAQAKGSRAHPVVVTKQGKELYRYPERYGE